MSEILVTGAYLTATVTMSSSGGLVSPTFGSAPNLIGRYVAHEEVCYEIVEHTQNEISIVGTWKSVPLVDDVVTVSWKFSDFAGTSGLALSENHHHATLTTNLRILGFLGDATMKYILFDNCRFFVAGAQSILAVGSGFWKSADPKSAGATVLHFQGNSNAFYGRDAYRDPDSCPVSGGGTLCLSGVEVRATPQSATQRSDFDLAEDSTVRFYHVTVNGPPGSYHHLNSVNAEYVHVNYVNTTAVELQRTPVRMEHFSSANTDIGFAFFPEHTDLHQPVRIKNLQPSRTASVMIKRNNRSALVVVDSDLNLDTLTTTGHAPIRFEFSLQDTAFNAQTRAVIPGVQITYLDGMCTGTVGGTGDTISNVVSGPGCPLVFGHFIIGDLVWVAPTGQKEDGQVHTVSQVTNTTVALSQPCTLRGSVEVYRCQERTTDARGVADPVHLPYAALFTATHHFEPCWKRVKHGSYERWLRVPVAAESKDVVELYTAVTLEDPEVMTGVTLPTNPTDIDVGQLFWTSGSEQMHRRTADGWEVVSTGPPQVTFRAEAGPPSVEAGDADGHYYWDTTQEQMYLHNGSVWEPVAAETKCPVQVGVGVPDDNVTGTLYYDEHAELLYSRVDAETPWRRLSQSSGGAVVVLNETRDPLPADIAPEHEVMKTWWHNSQTQHVFVLFALPGAPTDKIWLSWQNSCPSTIYKHFQPSMADGYGLPQGTLWVDLNRKYKYVWAPNDFGQLDWQLDVVNPAVVVVDSLPPTVDFHSGTVVYARDTSSLFLHDGSEWKSVLPNGGSAPDPSGTGNTGTGNTGTGNTGTDNTGTDNTGTGTTGDGDNGTGGTSQDLFSFQDPIAAEVPEAVFSMGEYVFEAVPNMNTLDQLHALLSHSLAVDGSLQVKFIPTTGIPSFVAARQRMFYIYKVHLNNDYFTLTAKQQNILVRWFILEEPDISRLITADKRASFVVYVQQAIAS